MIRHVLLFKFRPAVSDEQRQLAIAMLKSLGSSIPDVREWSVGEQMAPSPKAYDLAQVSSFDDLPALERFRHDPRHVKVRDVLAKIADWIVVDYEIR